MRAGFAGSLADVLFGKGRAALLALLYGHPDQSYRYRQITRQLSSISVGTLQRELETLSHLGLVERTSIGKQVFYPTNQNHPVLRGAARPGREDSRRNSGVASSP
jgi:uncharacterized protein